METEGLSFPDAVERLARFPALHNKHSTVIDQSRILMHIHTVAYLTATLSITY